MPFRPPLICLLVYLFSIGSCVDQAGPNAGAFLKNGSHDRAHSFSDGLDKKRSKILLNKEGLNRFHRTADSMIQMAVRPGLSYLLRSDTLVGGQIKHQFPAYFYSDSLFNAVTHSFDFPKGWDRVYRFSITRFSYTSIHEAKRVMSKVVTLGALSGIGLTKSPGYLARRGNEIIWLHTLSSISGKSYQVLVNGLKRNFTSAQEEEASDACGCGFNLEVKLNNLTGSPLTGKWRLKYLGSAASRKERAFSAAWEKDSVMIKKLDGFELIVSDSVIVYDSLHHPLCCIRKETLPEIRYYFDWSESPMHRDTLALSPAIHQLKGPFTRYSFEVKEKDRWDGRVPHFYSFIELENGEILYNGYGAVFRLEKRK
jgi:hypothetical protein